jgi:sulfate adenylyltransferase subunit 1
MNSKCCCAGWTRNNCRQVIDIICSIIASCVKAVVRKIEYKLDVNSLQQQPVEGGVKLNEVIRATIKTASPLVYDAYDKISENGSAILVDETSNSTVAAVMLQ